MTIFTIFTSDIFSDWNESKKKLLVSVQNFQFCFSRTITCSWQFLQVTFDSRLYKSREGNNLECNFKLPSYQRWKCPIHNGTLNISDWSLMLKQFRKFKKMFKEVNVLKPYNVCNGGGVKKNQKSLMTFFY